MRILILGNFPVHLYGDELGCSKSPKEGISTWLVNLADHLAHLDETEVHTWTLTDQLKRDKIIKHDQVTLHFSPVHSGLRTRSVFLFSEDRITFRRKIREIQPDIIHAHHTGEYAWIALNEKIPTLVTVHGVYGAVAKSLDANIFSFYRLLSVLERFCLKKSNYLISISPYINQYINSSFGGERFEIENPVNEIYFDCQDHPEGDAIIFIAVMSPIKGLLRLVEVLNKLKRHRPNVHLRVIGHYPLGQEGYKTQVESLVSQKNVYNNIAFLGPMDELRIKEEFEKVHCLLLTSFQETAPMVIAEAMAAGKPVVAMDVGGIRYMVQNGVTGFVIPSGDTQTMAERVVQILEDEHLRKNMGSAARRAALGRFHPDVVARKTRAVYEEILTLESKR